MHLINNPLFAIHQVFALLILGHSLSLTERSSLGFLGKEARGVPTRAFKCPCPCYSEASPCTARCRLLASVAACPCALIRAWKKGKGRSSTSAAWKATKEYLNQRGTKIRVLRVCFRTPFFPPFFPHFSPLFPLQALCIFAPLLPSSPPPFIHLFLAPGKVRFRYPSDLGTL